MQAAPTVALRLSLPDLHAEAETVKEAALEEADVGAGQSFTLPTDFAEAVECAAVEAWPEYDDGLTSGVPEGTGPLYKCAICDEVVYESQLDYHVQLCPAQSPLLQGTLDGIAEDAAEQLPSKRASQPSEFSVSSRSSGPAGRAVEKRSRAIEGIWMKEDEECTFAPKINARGQARTCLPSEGHDKWSQRWELQMRSERLKQVEAQVYADVTLRPKISRFAQAWSQRQSTSDGQQLLSVFERLYELSRLSRHDKGAGVAHSQMSDSTGRVMRSMDGDAAGGGMRPAGQPSPGELLYNDAFHRWEKLRAKQEQAALCEVEASGERKSAVLGKSRRYYWQMVERQVKSAFEAAAAGEMFLKRSSMEDFLVSFGCVRPQRERGQAPATPRGKDAPAAEETGRLCAALWRHLDPRGAGETDLLTLTVFFHVLMGAVDDAPFRSRASAGAGAASDAEAMPQSPARASPGEPPGSPPRSACRCQAFDVGTPGEDGFGDRIAELLQQFDPVRLRTDFPTLSARRMHYQSSLHEDKAPLERPEDVTRPPEIDPRSRQLAYKVAERLTAEAGKVLESHADLMMWRHRKTEAKKKDERARAKSDEVSGCTFRPQTCPKFSEPCEGSVSRHEVLYQKAAVARERREAKALEKVQAAQKAEVAQCTFRPDTSKSSRTYKSIQQAGPKQMPKGFPETKERLRAGVEIERTKWLQQNDRMAKMTPAAAGGMQSPTPSVAASGARSPRGATAASPDAKTARPHQPSPKAAGTACGAARPGASRGARGAGSPSPTRMGPAAHSPGPTGPAAAARRRAAGGSPSPVRSGLTAPRSPRGRAAPGAPAPGPAALPAAPQRPTLEDFGDSSWSQGAEEAAAESPLPGCGVTYAANTGKSVESMASCPEQTGSPVRAAAGKEMPISPASSEFLPVDTGGKAAEPEVANDGDYEEDGLPPPILYVDVNVVPDQPPERIVLREGQSVAEVAAEFAERQLLTPVMAKRLQIMLQEVVDRQRLSQERDGALD